MQNTKRYRSEGCPVTTIHGGKKSPNKGNKKNNKGLPAVSPGAGKKKRQEKQPRKKDTRGSPSSSSPDAAGGVEDVEALYREAQELAQPPISRDKFRALIDIKKRAEATLDNRRGPEEATGRKMKMRRSSSSSSSVGPLQRNGEQRRQETTSSSRVAVPYPAVTDPEFDGVIPRKKEFAMGAYPPVDPRLGVEGLWNDKCKPNEFILTPNQQVLKNFVSPSTPYNGLLLFHGVGTGKTCAAVTIAEQFPDKRVLVLVQPGLRSNFRDTIFDFKKLRVTETGMVDVMRAAEQCTGTRYLSSIPDSEMTDRAAVVKRIERAIKARYVFRGAQEFAKDVGRIKEEAPQGWEERLRQKYSNYVIIVDEAHHLRINLKDEERKAITPAIRSVLRYTEGVKLLLLTATPMFNDVSDVVELLNLLLTNDKRKPVSTSNLFDKRSDLTEEGERLLMEASRGYVSYLRGDDPFSFPLRLTPANVDDPNALTADDPSQPTMNIKSQAIHKDERMKHTVLMASDMSAYQRQAYFLLDKELKDATADGASEDIVDEIDEEDATRRDNAANTFMYGMGISNIVYPLHSERAGLDTATAGKLVYGKTGFNNCFVQVPGKGLRVRYADPSHKFLAGASLGVYAPKIKTIVDRIMKSEGIVFVYSKFLDSGIIPLAIALEHAGLSRYGQQDILSEETKNRTGGGGSADHKKKGWTYIAVTARKNDLSMNKEYEVEAARSPDNYDGSRVKVILGSENASEGLDFQNIREVHILDPWYHFNKTEQIVGRAARNCSHAALPVEKRNVTVYMHAARIRGSPRETIDLRAYRIAEQKQRRIMRVEAALVANSLDCNLNKHTQFYDPRVLNLRLDVVTSQGRRLPRYPIGDKFPRRKVTCTANVDVSENNRNSLDDSTYDAVSHASGLHSCKAVFTQMFRRHHAFTLEQVKAACREAFPTITDDSILMAIQETLDEHTPVQNPRGHDGHVIYASNKYMFQSRHSMDERDGLNALSRTGPSPDDPVSPEYLLPKHVVFQAVQRDSSSTRKSSSSRSRKVQMSEAEAEEAEGETSRVTPPTEDKDRKYADKNMFAEMTLDLLTSSAQDLQDTYGLDSKYEDVVLDFVTDRLDETSLMRVLRLLLHKNAKGVLRNDRCRELRVLESLKRGHVLWTDDGSIKGKKPTAFYMYDYFNDEYKCFDNGSLSISTCGGPFLQRAEAQDKGRLLSDKLDYRTLKGYLSPPSSQTSDAKARNSALFKIVGHSAESSGCVCHQTSSLKVDAVMRMIDAVNPDILRKAVSASSSSSSSSRTLSGGGGKAIDKKHLCILYELSLRHSLPTAFIRPAVSKRVFRQKGKRMILPTVTAEADEKRVKTARPAVKSAGGLKNKSSHNR